ncbi:insulinase family protein [Mesorhizobium sp. M0771]|uniref:insulinase family protein n=1 Tax=Mesorhizobium sp. M0771 TaxID=2956997 RepID=UPI00333503AD
MIESERNAILKERRCRTETNCWTGRSTRRCGQSALPHSGQRLEAGHGEAERHRRIHDLQRIPSNAVLVVAGDAEPETVKALAAKTYGKVARGPDLPPRNRPSSPTSRTARRLAANSDILPPTWVPWSALYG